MNSLKNYSEKTEACRFSQEICSTTMPVYRASMHTGKSNLNHPGISSRSGSIAPTRVIIPVQDTTYVISATAKRCSNHHLTLWHGFLKETLIQTSDM